MFFDLLTAVLLGILEGVTEWLPVSSTGHLILLEGVLATRWRPCFLELFRVVIQQGAMLAVLLLFWGRLCPFGKGKEPAARRRCLALWGRVLIAALPAAVIGFLLDDLLDTYLYRPPVVAGALVLYGVLFILIERCRKRTPSVWQAEDISVKIALLVGSFQVLSLVPGTSRSGATVMGGLLAGLSRPAAAEFSFFLGIPTMLGAGLLKGVKLFAQGETLYGQEVALLLVGCACAFLVSVVTIRFLMGLVRRHSFAGFGVYRILLGGAVLALWIFQ